MPHEILLRAANGEAFTQRRLYPSCHQEGYSAEEGAEKDSEWVEEVYYPSVTEQLDAAKTAAPYYAPRLSAQAISQGKETTEALRGVLLQLGEKLPS